MPPSVSGRDVYPNILGHLEFKFILVLWIFIWQLWVHFLDQMPANPSLKTKANLFLYWGLCCNVATFLSVLSSAALMLQWQSWIVVTRGCVVHTMVYYLTFNSKIKPQTGSPELPKSLREHSQSVPKSQGPFDLFRVVPRPTVQK